MVKELITRADAIIAEVRGETGGGSSAKISKSKNNLATFLKLHKGEHEKTSAQLDAILGVLKKDNQLEKKEAEADRKERERQKREKREKLIESLKSGVGSAASAGKKVVGTLVSPFKEVWEKIANFLKFTVIGVLFNSALNWFGKNENQEKMQNIGRFFKFWWPSLLAGYALFFTPIGSLVSGVALILTAGLPALAGLIAGNPILAAALAAGGFAVLSKMGFLSGKKSEDPQGDLLNQVDINQTSDTEKFNPINETKKNKEAARDNLERSGGSGIGIPFYNKGGVVSKTGPGIIHKDELVLPTDYSTPVPTMTPVSRGGRAAVSTPPSPIKISNSVVLPPIKKEKPRQQVREGSTIPTFQISSNANSRHYTLMGMGLEEMV
jgi:hypothetical protein